MRTRLQQYLDLYKGNCYLLLGENGAGKSTLIKLLLAHFEVNEWAIVINGSEDLNHINIKVGYMAQNDPHFFADFERKYNFWIYVR